jgi:hypothetical protein
VQGDDNKIEQWQMAQLQVALFSDQCKAVRKKKVLERIVTPCKLHSVFQYGS